MCLGNSAADQANTLAMQQYADQKKQEKERKANIAAGREKIDTAFSNFNDNYFNDYKNSYLDYYNPQIDKQFNDTNRTLTYRLADRGLLESSVGAESLGDLFKQYGDQKAEATNAAADAANKLKAQVEDTKTNLYSLNESASDPATVASAATGQASAIAQPQIYSQLGSLFADTLTPWNSYTSAKNNSAATAGGYSYYRPASSSYAVVG